MEENKIEKTPEELKKEAARERMAKAREARKAKKVESPPAVSPASPASPSISVKSSEIVWFTEVDLNDKGKVANDFASYYYPELIRGLEDERRALQRQLDGNVLQGDKKFSAEARVKAIKQKIDKIKEGTPNLQGPTKDAVNKAKETLGDQISDSMFSYDSHWKMTADPHTVSERMHNPCIEINNPIVAAFAKQRGMRVEDKKISQNDARIIYKHFAKALGEPTSLEHLQPVRSHGTTI